MKNDELNSESSAEASEAAAAEKPKRTRAKKSATSAEKTKPEIKKRASTAKARRTNAKTQETAPATKAAAKKRASAKKQIVAAGPADSTTAQPSLRQPFEDPIGDVSDGEAQAYTGEDLETDAESEAEAYRAGVAVDAVDGTLETDEGRSEPEGEEGFAEPAKVAEKVAKDRAREDSADIPPAKLERLQKILSQAGIASRRRAEEMIVAGRVVVNGQVVTALGSKADPKRDHIRVDGKLLHGAERHRYFVLNKPKGYVTTVSDPEGRPTVMEFVQKLGERVYPVGRLDYQSEGLLLMTNDGALANELTRAASGVEKTYLVKVAGQPDEEELERLRTGVMIERGGPSESGLYGAGGRVRSAPAQIRQIRQGENPWYEVVLTEGRNRELRKMFSAIGHYVEKIRRVGYGPLVLDVEPGKIRELSIEEVDLLRQAAEGKLKPRRLKTEAMLPKDAGRAAEDRPAMRGVGRPPRGRSNKPREQRGPERGAAPDFRQRTGERSGNRDFRGPGQERAGGKDFRRLDEGQSGGKQQGRFGGQERQQREFRGSRRDWRPRPGGERPVSKQEETRGRFESRRGDRGGDSGREDSHSQSPKRWEPRGGEKPFRREAGGGGRPFRAEGRAAAGRSGDRFGAANSGDKGRFEGFGGDRGRGGFSGKGKSGGYSGERRQGGFSAKGKSGGFGGERGGSGPNRFKGGRKPGGFRSGPRPGGRPSGGKRRG
ncbi:MAG TPA: pseudouridine synthase [Terracidiphilus sp.]|nr:pseudouridine synthase [Terracidiphilus sp.]